MPDIRLIQADDWEVLVKDGVVVDYGHHIRLDEAIKALFGFDVQTTYADDDDADALNRVSDISEVGATVDLGAFKWNS